MDQHDSLKKIAKKFTKICWYVAYIIYLLAHKGQRVQHRDYSVRRNFENLLTVRSEASKNKSPTNDNVALILDIKMRILLSSHLSFVRHYNKKKFS